jgi:hypothetical protein
MGEIGEKVEEMYDVLKGALERLLIIINRMKKVDNKLREIEYLLNSTVSLRRVNTPYDFVVRVKIEKRPLRAVNLNEEPYICVSYPGHFIDEIRLVCTRYQCDMELNGKGFIRIRNISDITVEKLIDLACNLNEKDFDALIEEIKEREIAYDDVIETLKKVVALVKMILSS